MDWANFLYKINYKCVMLTILFDLFYFFMIVMTSYLLFKNEAIVDFKLKIRSLHSFMYKIQFS